MTVVRHMFYGSYGTQNTMVAFIIRFGPRKGQYKVKLGQIRSDFQNQHFLAKACLSCRVSSQDCKNAICFYLRQLETPKIAFRKADVITFTNFVDHCTANNKKYCFEIWYVCYLCVALQHVVHFFDNSENLDFIGFFF